MDKDNSPEEIEKYLLQIKAFKDRNPEVDNLPTLEELDRSSFKQKVAAADYTDYVSSGDLHYVVGRLLFVFQIWEYALFSSQQAIENYLKAYIKLRNNDPRLTHSLKDLLDKCRNTSSRPPFIDSTYLEVIVRRFDPFNEAARYPVQRRRPADGKSVSFYPYDMYVLDYFIYKMREIIQLPPNQTDLFRSGHYQLAFFESRFPDIYAKFRENNMNFDAP